MKRDAEVKDSGQLVPGFGGVLDIIDSPLLACAVRVFAFQFVLTTYTAEVSAGGAIFSTFGRGRGTIPHALRSCGGHATY